MKSITDLAKWQALNAHRELIEKEHMRNWFLQNPKREEQFTQSVHGITLNYSRNRIQDSTLALLIELAKFCSVKEKLNAIYQGETVNYSENRPALHMRLRAKSSLDAEMVQTLERLQQFAHEIQSSEYTDIINIGMGGSHFGPLMTTHALKNVAQSTIRFHFLSTPDADLLDELLSSIQAKTSLFIISSKSFTTIETLTNASTIREWLKSQLGNTDVSDHFVAITANTNKALEFGIAPNHIFPMWEGVGGRYSIWSAIGLPLLLQIGAQQFDAFLQGAQDMDQHVLHADYANNLPILLALIGIWNNNFLGAAGLAIIPYAYRLKYLVPYLQQLDMESNGKSINQWGEPIHFKTGPIIFGQEGTDGQHAYHQWLHQSPSWAACDLIVIDEPQDRAQNHHHHLMKASALSQAEALMKGTHQNSCDHLSLTEKSRVLKGNRPTNMIHLKTLSPYHLGALIALYEHKIAVQGMIWQINSFDQWGVELGKQLLPGILTKLLATDEVTE